MFNSITPVLGAFCLFLLFLFSFSAVYGVKYTLLAFRSSKTKEKQGEAATPTPVYYVLQKRPAAKKKRTAKRQNRKPKQEVYYLSTLQKQEENE